MKTQGLQHSYDSIAQAAAAMGCLKSDLRKWKKLGAAGFRGSRVYPAELAAWLKQKEVRAAETNPAAKISIDGMRVPELPAEDDGEPHPRDKEAWEIRRIRLQCQAAELQNAEKRGELLEAKMVATSWILHTRKACAIGDNMVVILAPRVAGRSAAECERLMREEWERVKAELRARPYGDAPACCAKCGERIELFLEPEAPQGVLAAVVKAKGKRRKAE